MGTPRFDRLSAQCDVELWGTNAHLSLSKGTPRFDRLRCALQAQCALTSSKSFDKLRTH